MIPISAGSQFAAAQSWHGLSSPPPISTARFFRDGGIKPQFAQQLRHGQGGITLDVEKGVRLLLPESIRFREWCPLELIRGIVCPVALFARQRQYAQVMGLQLELLTCTIGRRPA